LSRYAPEDVDTDEKKQDYFLEGLNDGLKYSLASHDFKNFQALVDRALILEHKRNNIERKRKMDRQVSQAAMLGPIMTPLSLDLRIVLVSSTINLGPSLQIRAHPGIQDKISAPIFNRPAIQVRSLKGTTTLATTHKPPPKENLVSIVE
jgi:hypothetical protein